MTWSLRRPRSPENGSRDAGFEVRALGRHPERTYRRRQARLRAPQDRGHDAPTVTRYPPRLSFLIFQLMRLDVWPTEDLGVRKGYGLAWGIPMPTAKQLEPLGDPYRLYRSVLTWYCWRAAELYGGAAGSVVTR